MANPVGHFEFMINDPKKAREFYGKVFDWTFEDVPNYTMIDTGREPKGGMMKKPDQAPCCSLNVYFHVADLDDSLRRVEGAGGTVLIGTTEIETGWWAMFLDPDGIPVGLYQTK